MTGHDSDWSNREQARIEALRKAAAFPYVYRWDRQDRKGQPCKVTARGKRNSICVEFPDGYTMVTSGNAIRRTEEGK